jgi:hypothetical protein
MFIFKIEPSELIFVLDLNPDLAFVSGRRESASARARLAFESVIDSLSETESRELGFLWSGRGLRGFRLCRLFRFSRDFSLLSPRPWFSLFYGDGWCYCRSSSETFKFS